MPGTGWPRGGASQRGRWRAAAVLILTGAAVTSGAGAAAPTVRLRYGLQPETSYDQTTTLSLALQIKAEGLPEGALALLQAFSKDSKQDLRLQGRVEVGPKASNGTLPLTYRLAEAKGTLTMGGQTRDLLGDSQRLIGATLQGRLSSDGRTVDLDAGAEGAGRDFPAGVRERIAQSLPALPDRALGISDSFEIPGGMNLPGLPGGAQSQLDTKMILTLKSLNDAEAHFDVRQIMSVPPGSALPGDRTLSVSGGGEGAATYDRKDGIFTSLRLDLDVQVIMGMGASASGGDPRPGEAPPGTAAPPITLRALVRGPMAVTMARAPVR